MNFEQSVVVRALPAELFALSQDYRRRLAWDPFLRSAELMGDAVEAGIGVRAACVSNSGLRMVTEYVSYHPPRTCAVRMIHGPWFIDTFAGSWQFVATAPNHTRVICRYHMRAKPRWLAWLLTPLIGWVFTHETSKRLLALKNFAEENGGQIPFRSARAR